MARRTYTCDVPGCTHGRKRWQRLCDACFRALPGDIRFGITDAFRCRDMPRHRRECRRAGEFFKANPRTAPRAIGPAQAYANTQRLLGERS